MRRLGHPSAHPTPVGADGGIDVLAPGAIAQVKFRQGFTGRPDVQRLVGARERSTHLELWFFSMSGYSRQAIQYANTMDVHLYTYDLHGTLEPHSLRAQDVLAQHVQRTGWRHRSRPVASAQTIPEPPSTLIDPEPRREGKPGTIAACVGLFFWLACLTNILFLVSGDLDDPDWFIGVANLLLAISFTALSGWQAERGARATRDQQDAGTTDSTAEPERIEPS